MALALAMGGCFAAGAYAEDALIKVEAYLRPDFTIKVNGQAVALEDGLPPLIYNDRGYLPIKSLGTLLGANIGWDEATKSILVVPAATSGGPGPNPGTGIGKEMKLRTLVKYELIYQNVKYPVLASFEQSGGAYMRWSDLLQMPLDLSGVTLYTESYTKDTYVQVDQVVAKWGGQVTMDLRKDPIYTGFANMFQKQAIERYFATHYVVFSVQAVAENEFFVLAQNPDKRYATYTLRLTPVTNDYYSVSGMNQTILSNE